jgi:hypothetical protein
MNPRSSRWCSRSLPFACALVVLVLTALPRASAQISSSDKAMAEMLFDRGLTAMRQGDFESACPQLEQSQAIDRGIGTMLYLAECYEKLGRTASAWAMFREAASAARAEGQTDRANTGNARASRLEPQLSKLTINVAPDNRVPGLSLARNGEPIPPGVWGLASPVDPGEQHIEARAPGHANWTVSVNLPPNGASLNVDVPRLADLPEAPAPAPSLTPSPAQNAPQPLPLAAAGPMRDGPPRQWQKPLGLVLGGAGVVALGLGGYFGGRAISKNNRLNDACPDKDLPCAAGAPLQDSAHNAASMANVFVIGGAALLAGGLIVYFTAPAHDTQLSLSGHGSGAELQLRGNF